MRSRITGKRTYAKKLTPRNLYPSLKTARILRSFKSSNNYLTVKCEHFDNIQVTATSNVTTFASTGHTYINVGTILPLTTAWADYNARFLYYKINKFEIIHMRCIDEETLSQAFGPSGGAPSMHYRLYTQYTGTELGTRPASSDKVRVFSPFEFGRKVKLPFEKVQNTSSPWGQFALTSSSGSLPGQVSINDLNQYAAENSCRPYVVKFIMHVTFKDAKE